MKKLQLTLAFIILIINLTSALTFDKDPDKEYYAVPKVEAEMNVDGVLDEPFWENAVKIESNIEVRPGENIEAPVKTEAYLCFADNYIYCGFKCYDPEPEKIRAHITDRDNMWSDDWILILFDTFNDSRRMYDFVCNPFGIQGDIIESDTGGNQSWDAIWDSHGQINKDGYFVEMKIPFSSLGFQRKDNDAQIWGFDVVRSYPRNVRHHIGQFPRDRNNNCYLCQANKLVGFEGALPGKNIEFDPTINAINAHELEDGLGTPMHQTANKAEMGLTAKWGLTPNLMFSGTVNPDFSQVEADVEQMDINTQFALYYPEKRPFFLEGADMFESMLPIVYTRSLADPTGGVKLTGKEGPHTIGFFTAQDNITNFLFPGTEGSDSESLNKKNTSSVLRYKRDIGKSSSLGVMATNRQNDDYYNRLGAIDGVVKFTNTDQVRFQYAQSQTKYPDQLAQDYAQKLGEFSGHAANAYYSHETKKWEAYAYYEGASPNARADLGFATQVGFHYSEVGGMYKWERDGNSWYNRILIYSSYDLRRDWSYNPLHKANTFRINYSGPLQTYFTIYAERGENRFEGINYRANFVNTYFNMRPAGWLGLHWQTRIGDQIDYSNNRNGKVFNFRPFVDLKMGKHLSAEISHNYQHLDVDPGRLFKANISRLKLVYQFNKRLFLRTILQYKNYDRDVSLYTDEVDAKTEKLFSQILFSYKLNPQTVLFLGYADDYCSDSTYDLTQTNKTFFMKLGYAWRI